jgi:two-component system sensor histidine kinase SenX3
MTLGWVVSATLAVAMVAQVLLSRRRESALSEVRVRPAETRSARETRLASVVEHVPMGAMLADGTGALVLSNARASAMCGVRHVDVIVEDAAVEVLRGAAHGGERDRLVHVAGPPARSFRVKVHEVDGGDLLATIEDVTDQVRIDTVRTDFVANLSHELKTPIGGIAALSDTMLDEEDPEVVRRLARRIVDESYRMSGIVDDLLDLSRIEFSGPQHHERVDLASVIAEVVSLQQHTSEAHGVTVSVENEPTCCVTGDRSQLVSAVSNLVENAIKYSERGSAVRISCRRSGESILVVVADRGIGISASDQERIFERFFRVDRARSRQTGGTGLGLSIVRHVVDNHGGRISVRSAEGEGSTFTIELPALVTKEGVDD